MKEFNYNNYAELLKDVEDDLNAGSDVTIYAIGKDTEIILKGLLNYSGMSIAFLDYDVLDYCDEEYCVSVVSNELFVSHAKDRDKDRYLYTETDVCYINGDCNSALLPYIGGYKIIYNINDE